MKTLVGYVAEFSGFGLAGYGLWRIYHPVAYIMVGILLMLLAISLQRSNKS